MGKLYLIPTPIGNLEDITFRAINTLKSVDIVLAEDTRQTKKLFAHYDVQTPLQSYHQHNEHQSLKKLIAQIKTGKTYALVSDAGTPGISDPGFLLVRECIKENVSVECLPGATAFVPALVNSGIPCDRFIFEGFLPHKKGRQTRLTVLAEEDRTIVLYESPHRIIKTLGHLIDFLGSDRQVCVSRELTKIHEENIRGTLNDVLNHFEQNKPKGEIVIIIEGKKEKRKSKYEIT